MTSASCSNCSHSSRSPAPSAPIAPIAPGALLQVLQLLPRLRSTLKCIWNLAPTAPGAAPFAPEHTNCINTCLILYHACILLPDFDGVTSEPYQCSAICELLSCCFNKVHADCDQHLCTQLKSPVIISFVARDHPSTPRAHTPGSRIECAQF